MKGYKKILIITFFSLFLTSCFSTKNNDDALRAKQDLLGTNEINNNNSTGNLNDNNIESVVDEYIENVTKYEEAESVERNTGKYSVKYLTDERFLTLDSLENKNFLSMEVELTGKVLVDSVDRIVVSFSNSSSSLPDGNYELQQFKSGDKTFLYRAFNRLNSLDYGVNKYLIEAYSGNVVSKLEVTLNVSEDIENITGVAPITELKASDLPTNTTFGNPVEIGNQRFSYSDIRGLEIKNVGNIDLFLDGDSITSFLASDLRSWFFWNTLRPIKNNSGVSFFVLRLSGEKYYYEKHYYLPNGIYGVITLDSGEGISSSELSQKNLELSKENENFEILKISDELFREILN